MLVVKLTAVFQAWSGFTAGKPEAEPQVVLQPLEGVQEEDRHGGEGEHAAGVDAPRLLGLRVDADEPVDEPFRREVARRRRDPVEQVTERPVRQGQRQDQGADEYRTGDGTRHQNLSGNSNASTRKTVSRIARTRPTAFSAFTSVRRPAMPAPGRRSTPPSTPRTTRRSHLTPFIQVRPTLESVARQAPASLRRASPRRWRPAPRRAVLEPVSSSSRAVLERLPRGGSPAARLSDDAARARCQPPSRDRYGLARSLHGITTDRSLGPSRRRTSGADSSRSRCACQTDVVMPTTPFRRRGE